MDTMQLINEIWLDQPKQEHLHICVKLPTIRSKRTIPESMDVHSRIKRAKLANDPPSFLAESQNYERLQQDSRERILDDRPEPDRDIPPVPLLYPGFGHFLDIVDGCGNVPRLADVKVAELRKAVDRLAMKMTGFVEPEEEWREECLVYLRQIFDVRQDIKMPQILSSPIGSVGPVGHDIAVNGTSSIVVKFEKSHPGIPALPQVEVTGYFAHLNRRSDPELYRRWRVPCLGLTIVDCDITFYALLALDHQIRLVRLTPTYSCIQSASDGRDRRSLYLAFTAACVLRAHILEDAQKLLGDPTAMEIPNCARRYPAISKISVSKYATSPNPDEYLTFEICGLLDDRAYDRLLYKAKRPGADELILIKFVQRYSIELHDFCTKAGHAPSILGYERLPGGWFAVAMEYVEPGTAITKSDLLTSNRDRWAKELEHLVSGFHAKNLVHGDLRDANIICKGDSLMLIDFDWGGRVGEASYPTLELNPELLEDRASDDLRITKDDDVRV